MDHQLGAAGFVEEPLEYQSLLRRQHAKRGLGLGQIVGQLLCGGFVQTQIMDQPMQGIAIVDMHGDFFAQTRYAQR